ncbi:alkaline phosphatase family protein [Sphingomonas sp. AR_OL41]|uniref:alkaline phosphatase family protein n=1 Tax=Sphingomonas sp. AR_OL41 TaxID=3042729 RepID=UPI0024808EB3|nr:alkaline phosphatase family protein [Sphingomonas sp. AR_OL41]MDH7971849.1 alkaline phosphatase family protein [Sphingomonas sp. AR_OL41]
MKRLASLAALAAALVSAPIEAQKAPPPAAAPKLLVVVSVDQFSADLFAEYRNHATGGFARLLKGAVFPHGYQSHAATETCPGHSTILTGFRPEHTGIIANNWVDQRVARADKTVYCAEDESVPGMTSQNYTVSDKHLRVPTLGERMKMANAATRVVSVAGKDRAAVMMGGHKVDELWWWDGKAFVSYAGRATPPVVTRANAATAALIAQAQPALDTPAWCLSHDKAVPLADGKSVGTGHFERTAGDAKAFRASPAFDAAIVALAAGLVQDMKLGQGKTTDIISIGASATDYVGHSYGTEGAEMCIQLSQLDTTLGKFFGVLDRTGVDYEVVLTADHGGNDLPEREVTSGIPEAQRVDLALAPAVMGKAIAAKLGITGATLRGDIPNGDVWLDAALTPAQRSMVLDAAVAAYSAHPQVAAVFTAAQIRASAEPSGPPEGWTLLQKARASYDAERSGDLLVFLKPRVTAIPDALHGYVATHGSPWDYDRRVPILFWRKGMAGFEHPAGIETVDIAPTLAAQIGLALPKLDGTCRDLGAGQGAPCR